MNHDRIQRALSECVKLLRHVFTDFCGNGSALGVCEAVTGSGASQSGGLPAPVQQFGGTQRGLEQPAEQS